MVTVGAATLWTAAPCAAAPAPIKVSVDDGAVGGNTHSASLAGTLRRHLLACLAPAARRAPLLVGLRWRRQGRRFQAVVDVTWGAGRLGARLLRGRRAGPLLEAAAVATCVALDQAIAAGSTGPAPPQDRRPPATTHPAPRRQATPAAPLPAAATPAAPAEPTAQTPPAVRLGLHVSGFAAAGLVPSDGVSGGVEVVTSARGGWLSTWAGLRGLLPGLGMAAGEARRVRSSVASLVAGVCGHTGGWRLCPLATVGLRWSEGTGFDRSSRQRTLNGEVGGRLGWRLTDAAAATANDTSHYLIFSKLGLGVWLDVTVPWVKTTLRADDSVVWRRQGAAVALGVEATW